MAKVGLTVPIWPGGIGALMPLIPVLQEDVIAQRLLERALEDFRLEMDFARWPQSPACDDLVASAADLFTRLAVEFSEEFPDVADRICAREDLMRLSEELTQELRASVWPACSPSEQMLRCAAELYEGLLDNFLGLDDA